LAGAGVEHLGGGGDGVVGAHLAGEEVGDEIGEEEDAFGGVELRGVVVGEGGELEEGVEGHGLDAGDGVKFLLGDVFEDLFGHAFGAGVAVAVGIGEELAVGVEECEVDAPGIGGDAGDFVGSGGFVDAGFDFVPESEDVPVEGVVELDGDIGEAMDFGELDAGVAEGAEHDAAGFGAEVDGEVVLFSGHESAPSAG